MRGAFKQWEGIIGRERNKEVVEILYNQKINNGFSNDYTYFGNRAIISTLETVGKSLLQMDFLETDEKREMVNVLADELISKNLPEEFIKSLNEILEKEFEEESWLQDEIDDIKELLKELERKKKRLE